MRALLLGALLVAAPGAWAACPAQEPSLVAVGGNLRVCTPEAADEVEVERDGQTITVSGPFLAGETVPLVGVEACANVVLRARARNAAGAGGWGANVAATFPPCTAPVLVGVP